MCCAAAYRVGVVDVCCFHASQPSAHLFVRVTALRANSLLLCGIKGGDIYDLGFMAHVFVVFTPMCAFMLSTTGSRCR
jgi:hypothetical protein